METSIKIEPHVSSIEIEPRVKFEPRVEFERKFKIELNILPQLLVKRESPLSFKREDSESDSDFMPHLIQRTAFDLEQDYGKSYLLSFVAAEQEEDSNEP